VVIWNLVTSDVTTLIMAYMFQVWEKSGYNTVEWVRYITRAGSYEIRC
jgi:hypothetical protein